MYEYQPRGDRLQMKERLQEHKSKHSKFVHIPDYHPRPPPNPNNDFWYKNDPHNLAPQKSEVYRKSFRETAEAHGDQTMRRPKPPKSPEKLDSNPYKVDFDVPLPKSVQQQLAGHEVSENLLVETPAPRQPIAKKKRQIKVAEFQNLPTDITAISKISERDDIWRNLEEKTDLPPYIFQHINPEELSVVNTPIFYLEENEDIDFIKDLSSYSRSVFGSKDPEKEVFSRQILDPAFVKFGDTYQSPTDFMCLDIASDKVNDKLLGTLIREEQIPITNRSLCLDDFAERIAPGLSLGFGAEDLNNIDSTYHQLHRNDEIGSFKAMDEDQLGQTLFDCGPNSPVGIEGAGTKVTIKRVLENLISIKGLKKPLVNMPHHTEMAKTMEYDVNSKLEENLNILAQKILGVSTGGFEKNVMLIVKSIQKFQTGEVEGVPKTRLIKLLLNEIRDLKGD
jgi:hypothetical protein